MREVEARLELLGNRFVSGELTPIVRGDGVYLLSVGFEQPGHGVAHGLRGFTLDLLDQRETGLAFDQAHDGLPMVLADDGVCLPVANSAPRFDDGRAIVDGGPVRNRVAQIMLAVALPAYLLTAQVLPQPAASPLVRIDALIQRLRADLGMGADLFRAPLLPKLLLGKLPGGLINGSRVHRTLFQGHAVRLFRAITA